MADGGAVNHDCNDAILIGDPIASPNGLSQAGTVFVVYGRSQLSYPGNQYVAALQQYGRGYRIEGPVAGAHYGTSVADAGDLDGDGIPDVIAGAPGVRLRSRGGDRHLRPEQEQRHRDQHHDAEQLR